MRVVNFVPGAAPPFPPSSLSPSLLSQHLSFASPFASHMMSGRLSGGRRLSIDANSCLESIRCVDSMCSNDSTVPLTLLPKPEPAFDATIDAAIMTPPLSVIEAAKPRTKFGGSGRPSSDIPLSARLDPELR